MNLEYATIRAPISGRIGDSLVQVGGLVTSTSAQPLTTIVPLDPIWVRFKVSESEYLDHAERRRMKRACWQQAPRTWCWPMARVYPYPGRVQNTVNQVDSKTGTLELQATFPNPQHTLLPGQFGRVRLQTGQQQRRSLVPQRAVQDMQGSQSVSHRGTPETRCSRAAWCMGERVGDRVDRAAGAESRGPRDRRRGCKKCGRAPS